MTPPDRDYDDILSRALHAAVDQVEPSGEGLDRIRRRLDEPWALRQARLLLTECADLVWLAVVRLDPVLSKARSHVTTFAGMVRTSLRHLRSQAPAAMNDLMARIPALPRYDAAHRTQAAGTNGTRLRPALAKLRPVLALAKLRPVLALAKLRPVLAVAGAVVIVVAGVFALTQLHATISDIGLITGANVSTPTSTTSPSAGHSHSSRPRSHRPRRATAVVGPTTPAPAPAPSPTATCTQTPKATSSPKPPAGTASAATSPSATSTPSATATGTATATPTATSVVSPSTSATASPSPATSSQQPSPAATSGSTAPARHQCS